MNKYYIKIRDKLNEIFPPDNILSELKPVSLRDMFLLLESVRIKHMLKRGTPYKVDMDTKGYLTISDFAWVAKNQIYLDLAKPFKDQEPDVHKAVWGLIKES